MNRCSSTNSYSQKFTNATCSYIKTLAKLKLHNQMKTKQASRIIPWAWCSFILCKSPRVEIIGYNSILNLHTLHFDLRLAMVKSKEYSHDIGERVIALHKSGSFLETISRQTIRQLSTLISTLGEQLQCHGLEGNRNLYTEVKNFLIRALLFFLFRQSRHAKFRPYWIRIKGSKLREGK